MSKKEEQVDYRLYIDYCNKGYKKVKEHSPLGMLKKLDNSEFRSYIIIKEENNTDEILCYGIGDEYKEIIEQEVKILKKK